MKRILILFCFVTTFLYSYDQLIKWDKEIIKTEQLSFDGNNFLINDGKKISINEASMLKFNMTNQIISEKSEFIEDISEKELLRRAEILGKKYPDNSKLILLDDGIQRMNFDGTQFSRSRYALKIMNEKELDEALLSFYHIPGEYENRIIMARSISSDGQVNYLNPDDISYTSPSQGLQFFSGKKDTKIIKATIPFVKVGSIIDYEWETNDLKPEDKNQFYTNWYFGGDSPVYESIVNYAVPENRDFYWVAKNFSPYDSKPTIKKKDGYIIYTFKRGECPPFIPEPQAPPKEELLPFVFGSTFSDQTYLSEWLAKFFKERMIFDDKIKETVLNIIEKNNANREEEKIAILYRFVQEYIHYRSIKTSISSGMAGHPATETFYNKYGDCIDKSIFFATILSIVGVEAYPVIVMTNDRPRPLYGEIGLIRGNHAINEIHLKEENGNKKIIYLDSTSTTYKYPDFRSDNHGIPVWNPILNSVREISPPNPKWNTQEFIIEIELTEGTDGIVYKKNNYSGEWEAGLRSYFLSMKEKEIESLFISISSRDYPGSKLIGYNFNNPSDYKNNFSIDYKFNSKDIIRETGDFYIFSLPVKYSFDFTGHKERKYPIRFDTTYVEKHKVSVKFSDKIKLKGIPKDIVISNKYFDFNAKYEINDNEVIYYDHFSRKNTTVNPEDYALYRSQLLLIEKYVEAPLVFIKK